MVHPAEAYCVLIDTVCEGTVPSIRDGSGRPCLFATRAEAEREIADTMMARLQEFIEGERDFEDAATLEERVEEVRILDGGSVITSEGVPLSGL